MAVNWNEISNKIVIEGEAEYKKSMANINRALREAKSEMKAAAAEYDANSDSIDALKASMDALQNVEQGQNLALATMEKHLKRVEETTGESSREAVELRTKINNLRAEITRTNSDLSRFEQMMNDARDAMEDVDADKAADAIGELNSEAQAAEGGVSGLLGELGKVAGIDLGNLAGIGALAAAGKFTLEIAQKGVDSAVEQTQARGQIAAYTGATGADLESLAESGKLVYREGFGDSLKEASQHVATVNSYTGAMNQDLEEATMTAIRLDDVFGMDVPESARTARQMMGQFGLSVQDAYALIASGAQEGADKNGNLLDTLNEYAPYYAKAGKSAEEFMGTLISGAQNGVYDVDKIGDAMKEFTIRVTDGSEATKEALKGLGLESTDVPSKFAMGGETASAVFDLIIDKLMAVQDPLTQSQLGIALFGTQWEDTGGAVLEIFDQISGSATDTEGSLDALNATRFDDLEVGLTRSARQVEERIGEISAPVATGLAHITNTFADNMEENEGKILESVGETAAQVTTAWAGSVAEAFENAETKAVEETADLKTQLEALEKQIDMAWMMGDATTAVTLEQQRLDLISEIELMESEAQTAMDAVGETMTESLESADADMETAGETVGEAGVLGLEDGLEGMEKAGEDAADGAVAGALSREAAMSSAGARLGSAFVGGYKRTMEQRSPSRLMMRTAHDTVGGALEGFKEDEKRMQEAGAALAAAVSGGYGDPPLGSAGASYGANSGSGGDTVAALREALSGMGIYMKGEKVGELCEMGVSRAQTRRAMNTVSGLSTATKAW